MEFTAEELRLIRAMCITSMGGRDLEDYWEPWKSVYQTAGAKLKELGEEI